MWFLPFAFQIIFLETICNDKDVLERNIRLKVQQSPDYAEQWEITYLLSYAHPIGALLYAIVIFYVTGQILKLACGISKSDWPIMKRSIITEYIEKIPLMSLQISYIPHIPSQNCLSTVCHLYAKPLVFVPFLTGWQTSLFVPFFLHPLSSFFSSWVHLWPWHVAVPIQNSKHMYKPNPTAYTCCFHFILFWSPIRIWAKMPGWITARDRCRWHAERNERSLVGSWRQGYIGNLGHVFMD